MISPASKLIAIEELIRIVTKLKSSFSFNFDPEKHRYIFQLSKSNEFYLRLPLPIVLNDIREDLEIEELETKYLIAIIQSGSAALAYCEGLQIIEHKVFKAYMVRKKQGKSQLKYLKTKGKSKAGSRVRLSNTEHFFDEIIEKMDDWLSYFEVNRIAMSLNKTLYPYFFHENNTVLNKQDERIFKIPKHIEEPSFENLLKTHNFLLQGELIYPKVHEEMINKIIKEE